MRIAIITQDEPIYLPRQVAHVIEQSAGRVVAVIILPPLNETRRNVARRLLRLFGLRAFLGLLRRYACAKLSGSVERAADRAGVPVYRPDDVNEPSFVRIVRLDIRPDIVVSLSATQILRGNLLSIPPKGCINVHSGPLPHYRGHMPCFRAMLNDEESTAVTVHYMDEAIDAGDIILQEEIKIHDDETLDSLIRRCKDAGADLVTRALEMIEAGTAPRLRNDPSEGSYFPFPGVEEGRRFRKKGKRFW
ncbi:MAG: hypothetical protein GXP25_06170 [Planctomycetes bacterium]|nr:hypothetical protein [Planctomycetota bacterium]